MRKIFLILLCAALMVALFFYFYSSPVDITQDVQQALNTLPKSLDYNVNVKPILSDKCFACHGPDIAKQKAGLRLDFARFAYAELPENKGKVAIDPGNLDRSEVFHRIISTDPN